MQPSFFKLPELIVFHAPIQLLSVNSWYLWRANDRWVQKVDGSHDDTRPWAACGLRETSCNLPKNRDNETSRNLVWIWKKLRVILSVVFRMNYGTRKPIPDSFEYEMI